MDALPEDRITGEGWALWSTHSAASPALLYPALQCAASQAVLYC